MTFLDPVSKSGVFLREITRRLTDGLGGRDHQSPGSCRPHPDQASLRHRHHRDLTSDFFARRSVYCLKDAAGPYRSRIRKMPFTTKDGNTLVRGRRALVEWLAGAVSPRGEGWQVPLLRSQPEDPRSGRRFRDPRLRVHPYRPHRGSRCRAMLENEMQFRTLSLATRPISLTMMASALAPHRSTSTLSTRPKHLIPATCPSSFRRGGMRGGKGSG